MTEFLIGGRGTGKSQAALKWVRGAGNRYLVVPDSGSIDSLLAMDRANTDRLGGMRLHPEKFMSYAMGGTRHSHGQTVEYGVDGLDLMLRQIFGREVGFVTATGSLHGGMSPDTNTISIGGSR